MFHRLFIDDSVAIIRVAALRPPPLMRIGVLSIRIVIGDDDKDDDDKDDDDKDDKDEDDKHEIIVIKKGFVWFRRLGCVIVEDLRS